MNQIKYEGYEHLPMTLCAMETANALSISRSGAYEFKRERIKNVAVQKMSDSPHILLL